MSWQIICSKDRTLLAEVIGQFKRNSVPPAKSYRILGGLTVQSYTYPGFQELRCPNHSGKYKPFWKQT